MQNVNVDVGSGTATIRPGSSFDARRVALITSTTDESHGKELVVLPHVAAEQVAHKGVAATRAPSFAA